MICRDALLLLEFARPGATELDAADIAALETHLADCRPCSAFARADRQFHDQLSLALKLAEPSDGKAKVMSRIRNRHRQWQKRSALLVATVIFAFASIWGAMPRPKLDPQAILDGAQAQMGNLDGVNDWLARIDRRFQFPPGMLPKYLVSYELRNIHKTKAPVLTFVRGDALARVTVLTSKQFRNLTEFANGAAGENSIGTALILRDDANYPGVVYFVEILNGTKEQFFKDEESTVM